MKTTVTLTRLYKKEVTIEVDNKLLEGKSNEEIADYLMDEWECENEEELFDKAELEGIYNDEEVDDNRYDIYEDGKQVYGGHL